MLEAAAEMHACGEWEITPEALAARFDTLVEELAAVRDLPTVPAGVLPYFNYWLLEEKTWIGLLTLRPNITNELLRSGGHIGYAIRASRRRQGLPTCS